MAGLVDKRTHGIGVIRLPRNKNLQIVCQADQSAVKHPMRCPRKRDSVVHDIGTARLNGTNVGRVDFRTTATVNEF